MPTILVKTLKVQIDGAGPTLTDWDQGLLHGPMDIYTRVFHNIDVIDKTRAEVEGLAAEGVSLSLKDLLTLKSRFSKPCRTMNKVHLCYAIVQTRGGWQNHGDFSIGWNVACRAPVGLHNVWPTAVGVQSLCIMARVPAEMLQPL